MAEPRRFAFFCVERECRDSFTFRELVHQGHKKAFAIVR